MKPSVLNRMKVTDEATALNAYEKGNALSREVVLVAMDASRKITGYALEWALGNVIQQGDKIVFLAIVPSNDSSKSGWKRWGFPKVAGECAAVSVRSSGKEDFKEIHKQCSDVMQQLHKFHDSKKVHITTEIVQFAERGIVASEAKRLKATWVVLDRHLKREVNFCLQEVHSNLVLVNRLNPKILRLNLNQSLGGRGLPFEEPSIDTSSVLLDGLSLSVIPRGFDQLYFETIIGSSTMSTASSVSSSPATDFGTPPPSNFDAPVFLSPSKKRPPETKPEVPLRGSFRTGVPFSEPNTGRLCSSKQLRYQGSEDNLSHNVLGASKLESSAGKSQTRNTKVQQTQLLSELMSLKEDQNSSTSKSTKDVEKNSPGNSTPSSDFPCKENGLDRISSVRKEMHLSKHSLPCPPPLCSICQHKGPIFGKPPRRFTFAELQLATAGFSDANFLAEGGFGSVYRGLLPDGQPVAVKQHKLASAQGDKEFCSEVEVLSCAQHRNLVMLTGYCVEDKRRLLVYEFVCNGSLDTHLYGKRAETASLEWSSRQKIAVGAARALRYLHEECRVGCIVHRDMRPNNILLTHDFEPMVGDFGLARWQPYGDLGEETRVIGAFGYLAPEYAQTGQITEKADVYSFGVVLLELVTGRKAIDMSRNKGEMCLTEWARPFLHEHNYHELIDPRLEGRFSAHEVRKMLQAASLCIDQKPRPRMSQVLRLLEEDSISEISSPSRQIGSPLSINNSRYSPASSPSTRMFGISPITRLSSSSSSSNVVSPLSSNTPQQGGRRTTKELYAKYLRSTMLSTDSYRGMVKRTELYGAGGSPYNGTSKSHTSEIYGTT